MREDPRASQLRALASEKLDDALATAVLLELSRCRGLLAPGESPVTLAVGALGRTGRIIVATDRRLLLVETGLGSNHGHVDSLPWERVRAVRGTGLGFQVETDDDVLELGLIEPAERACEIADVFRARTGAEAGLTRGELGELARRKLGAQRAGKLIRALAELYELLEPGESVRTLASAKHPGRGLLALTDRRLVFCRARLFGALALAESWPLHRMTSASHEDGALRVALVNGEAHFGSLEPAERAWELAVGVRGSLDRGPDPRGPSITAHDRR